MSLLDDLDAKIKTAWNEIATTGAPAAVAAIEQYGADQLSGLAKQNQATATAAANQAIASGQPSSGLMASIQNVFGGVATNAFVNQNGATIVIAAVIAYIVIKKVL